MPGALAAAANAGAAAAAPAASPQAAAAKPGADSFIAALGLNPAQPAKTPDPKPAPPPPDDGKHQADQAGKAQPPAPVDSTVLAWLLNLAGAGATAATPALSPKTVAGEGAEPGAASAKPEARPAAASSPAQAGITPSPPLPAASADAAASAINLAATPAVVSPAPVPAAASRDKTEAAPTPSVGAPAPDSAAPPAAPLLPQVPVPVSQHSFADLLAQARDPAAPSTPAPHASLPADSAAWPAALNEHVRWQLGEGVQEARLELHPRELGSVQVQLRISPHGAEVQFAAAQPQARQALEASLPQLRALLAADGLHLAQANVGSQSQSRQPAQPGRPRFSRSGESAGTEAARPRRLRITRVGLVDAFA